MVNSSTFFKYAIVGGSGALINMGVLYLLTDTIGLYYLFSAIIAIELSIISNFYWNDTWTFSKRQKSKPLKTRIVAYHLISFWGAALNVMILFILTTVVGVNYLISNAVAIVGVFALNYFLNSRVTWKKAALE